MKPEAIREHWSQLAEKYGEDFKATTKTSTIKQLEINALIRAIGSLDLMDGATILEIGCGNGLNCIALADAFPAFQITGVDYIEQMVRNANDVKEKLNFGDRVIFLVGDVLELEKHEKKYDVVLTDRCLINLHERSLQDQALKQICDTIIPSGHLVLIENFNEGYSNQNDLRESTGMKRRIPDEYNLFFNEQDLMNSLESGTKLISKEYFASLHDLVLYVLVPMITGGTIDYEHPWVKVTTELLLKMPDHLRDQFGAFGQNCLYVFRKVDIDEPYSSNLI